MYGVPAVLMEVEWTLAAAAAKSLQSRPTLCDPIDGSPPGSWESPGKNTGVGCHFFLQCMKVKSESEVALSCPTLSDSTVYYNYYVDVYPKYLQVFVQV